MAIAPATPVQLESIRELVHEDMMAVDQLILRHLQSDVVLINQLGHYIINSGGKRLRPLVVLLSARACDYHGNDHLDLAAVIEFIHTATLLHDDVVDDSEMRRGRDTANAIWGNEASVLVGDFLYSRSFEMMVEVGRMGVMEVMSHTTRTIAEGEVLQLLNRHDPDTTEHRYMEVVQSKTAKLFAAAGRIGAQVAGLSEATQARLGAYGMHLGTAFQLIDDVLDYRASVQETGKNIGDDLAEGKPTLPLLHAMACGTATQAQAIRQAIEQGGRDQLGKVLEAIESTQAIPYTESIARQEAALAIEQLDVLGDSAYKEALEGLAQFSVNRSF